MNAILYSLALVLICFGLQVQTKNQNFEEYVYRSATRAGTTLPPVPQCNACGSKFTFNTAGFKCTDCATVYHGESCSQAAKKAKCYSVFAVNLEELHEQYGDAYFVVDKLISLLEYRAPDNLFPALKHEGIHRGMGLQEIVENDYIKPFTNDKTATVLDTEKLTDKKQVDAASAVLRFFFRSLPTRVFPDAQFYRIYDIVLRRMQSHIVPTAYTDQVQEVMSGAPIDLAPEDVADIKDILETIPGPSLGALQRLIEHLYIVSQTQVDEHKMDAGNLSKIFTTNIVSTEVISRGDALLIQIKVNMEQEKAKDKQAAAAAAVASEAASPKPSAKRVLPLPSLRRGVSTMALGFVSGGSIGRSLLRNSSGGEKMCKTSKVPLPQPQPVAAFPMVPRQPIPIVAKENSQSFKPIWFGYKILEAVVIKAPWLLPKSRVGQWVKTANTLIPQTTTQVYTVAEP